MLGQIATLVQDVDPFMHKQIQIQVPGDREVEARDILEPVLHPLPGLRAVEDEEGSAH